MARLTPRSQPRTEENARRLASLPGPSYIARAQDSGHAWALKKEESWTNAPATLELQQDAQVVLLKNLDTSQGLVNGSRGVVVGFSSNRPVVRFANGEIRTLERETWIKKNDTTDLEVARRTQYPLALA
jgi:ATP-dependent DNA helicase PIF1